MYSLGEEQRKVDKGVVSQVVEKNTEMCDVKDVILRNCSCQTTSIDQVKYYNMEMFIKKFSQDVINNPKSILSLLIHSDSNDQECHDNPKFSAIKLLAKDIQSKLSLQNLIIDKNQDSPNSNNIRCESSGEENSTYDDRSSDGIKSKMSMSTVLENLVGDNMIVANEEDLSSHNKSKQQVSIDSHSTDDSITLETSRNEIMIEEQKMFNEKEDNSDHECSDEGSLYTSSSFESE